MARVCEICGKQPLFGHKISHAHNVSNRRWLPNLHTVRAVVGGRARRIKVCASCLKAGKVEKASRAKPAKAQGLSGKGLSPAAAETKS